MKKDFLYPILALSMICLVMAGALALVNDVTSPTIEEAAIERANVLLWNIIPDADDFILVDIADRGLPASIVSVYRATNDTGFIITSRVRGFGGEMLVMSGVGTDGSFLGTAVLDHSETISFANRVFMGQDEYGVRRISPIERDVVAGATITFKAYRNAVIYAMEAFELLGGR